MKKIIAILLLVTMALTIVGCSAIDTLTLEHFEKITNNDAVFYYLKVDNEQDHIDLDNYLFTPQYVEWHVYEKNATNIYELNNHNIALREGNNTFIIKTQNIFGQITEYTIHIYRNKMFYVTFEGLDNIIPVEEGSCVSMPDNKPRKKGFLFVDWDWDFSRTITEDVTISAIWKRNVIRVE